MAPRLATKFCALQNVGRSVRTLPVIPPLAREIHSPLKLGAWANLLHNHPNQAWVNCLLTGLQDGVRIGFDSSRSCQSAKANMLSATQHPSVVQAYLREESMAGNLAGPFSPSVTQGVILNRFGVIPKQNKPDKWRLIVDLSHPNEHSVNDGISEDDASITYSSVADAARFIVEAGQGAQLAKIDIASAFRIIPVHPDDRHLLGMFWDNSVFIDKQLPFGLRSAPAIFNAYADALEWILREKGITRIIHYLDDFLVIGAPNTGECQSFLDKMLSYCNTLGFPLATDKIEGPCTSLCFLGICLDTIAMEAKLPDDKLLRLSKELGEWTVRKACTRRELEHLIGLLHFACNVIPQGRPFVRRLINLLCIAGPKPYHHVRLNAQTRSDILWWHTFISSWNRVSLLHLSQTAIPSANVFSDASGSWGCGAVWGKLWCQGRWPADWAPINIMVKELVPVVIAAALWGRYWTRQLVIFHIDNMAVVEVLNKGSSKEPSGRVMHLLRCLSFICAHHQFSFKATHVAGVHNSIADAISRNFVLTLALQEPPINPQLAPIPPALWTLLVEEQPDWTSNRWRQLWSNFILTA